jgi:hypothetical protein
MVLPSHCRLLQSPSHQPNKYVLFICGHVHTEAMRIAWVFLLQCASCRTIVSSSHCYRIASSVLLQLPSQTLHALNCWLGVTDLVLRRTYELCLAWETGLLRHDAVTLGEWFQTFRNNLMSLSSRIKQSACYFLFWETLVQSPACRTEIFLASKFSWFLRQSILFYYTRYELPLHHKCVSTVLLSHVAVRLLLRIGTCWITTILIILTAAMSVICQGLHNFFSQTSALVCLCQGYHTRGQQVYFIRRSHWYYSRYGMWPSSVPKDRHTSWPLRLKKYRYPCMVTHSIYLQRDRNALSLKFSNSHIQLSWSCF